MRSGAIHPGKYSSKAICGHSIEMCKQRRPGMWWGALACSLAGIYGPMAAAQTPPDAGALRRQIEQDQGTPLPPKRPAPIDEGSQLAAQPGGAQVQVQSFAFTGNSLISSEELARVVAPWAGKPQDLAGLQAAAAAVGNAYRSRGWVVRAQLPRQEISNGIVQIEVVEGRLGKVFVEADQDPRVPAEQARAFVAAGLQPGEPLTTHALDRGLMLADDLPGVVVAGRLQAGAAPGETDVALQLGKESFVSGMAGIDNYGVHSTGSTRASASLGLASPLGIGDFLGASLIHSQGSDYLRGEYTVPVGVQGLRLGVNGTLYRYDIQTAPFDALDAHGKSTSGGLQGSYPIIRSRNANLVATATSGNVLVGDANGGVADTDVDGGAGDPVDYGEALRITGIRNVPEDQAGALTPVTGPTTIQGRYGDLLIRPDGSYTYTVVNDRPATLALAGGQQVQEVFSYQVTDLGGLGSLANLRIAVIGSNEAPAAADDAATAVEAGGVANGTPGTNPQGNVIAGSDTDPDIDPGTGRPETLAVTAVRTGQEAGTGTGNVLANDSDVDGGAADPVDYGETKAVQGYAQGARSATAGNALAGAYGSLVIGADGSYTYTVDENNAAVQALRTDADTLTESFTYTMLDAAGATSAATLTLTIHGRDDAPVARDDANVAAAGTIRDPGQSVDAVGNLLPNDSDVDAGDTKAVTEIGVGAEAANPARTAVTGANQAVQGLYGRLYVNADGSYTYQVDVLNLAVQALAPGDTLDEYFTYQLTDTAGLSDLATLHIVVAGIDNPPFTLPDQGDAVEAGGTDNGTPGADATGNVLANDLDLDGDALTVTGIRTGPEAGTGTAGTVGQPLQGRYGTLTLNPDGSYTYVVNDELPAVQALRASGQTLEESFTYTAADPLGETDTGLLRIVIDGRNDAPVAHADAGSAVEAGGLDNGTAGSPPTGNELDNDADVDGAAYGETRTVQAFGQAGVAGTVGSAFVARYGTLTLNADGSYTYAVDDANAEVQALRTALDRLTEVFDYTMVDAAGATSTATLTITIHGRNDAPEATDDLALAVEAGGVGNGTPGQDAVGNVLDNDGDVDSTANGESRSVLRFANGDTGGQGAAGSTVAGRYGQLVIHADGSFRYLVDNDNPAVQALRTGGQTLTESFDYLMRDTQGATSQARLVIVVRGADDNPVARDDSNLASDQVAAPQAGGNVLPNDADVDGGDALQVSAIRTGAEGATGTAGQLGQALAGRYGTLVIHADGSYSYSIDMRNPEVLAAAGFGQVLHDVFTYTVADRAGATDLAQLTISLDISAPRIDSADPLYFRRLVDWPQTYGDQLGFEPGIFVQPVVRQNALADTVAGASSDGTRVGLVLDRGLIGHPASLGSGLGEVPGQFVGETVRESQLAAQLELARLAGRHGRVSLSADGLLADPSLFSLTSDGLLQGEAQRPGLNVPDEGAPPAGGQPRTTAPAFSEQLRQAARQASSMPR